jgi:hypothetical protein
VFLKIYLIMFSGKILEICFGNFSRKNPRNIFGKKVSEFFWSKNMVKFFSKYFSECFREIILESHFRKFSGKILETFYGKNLWSFSRKKCSRNFSQNLFHIFNIVIYICTLVFMFLWTNNKPHRGLKLKGINSN